MGKRLAIIAVLVAISAASAAVPSAVADVGPSADGLPPVLSALAVSTTHVDLGSTDRTVTVTASVSDPAGVRPPVAFFGKTSQEGREYGRKMRLLSGTTSEGTWTATFSLPADLPAGDAWVGVLPLVDDGGMAESRVHRLWQDPVDVTAAASVSDTTAPRVVEATIVPATVNVSDRGGEFTARVHLSDPSGVVPPQLSLVRPYATPVDLGTATLEAGEDDRSGTWTVTKQIPRGSTLGTWSLKVSAPRDRLGNVASEPSVVADDAVRITERARQVPGEPTSVSVQPADGSAELSLQGPINDALPVVGWEVTSPEYPGRTWSFAAQGKRDSYHPQRDRSEVTVMGLTNGRPVDFVVAARNELGVGPSVSTYRVTPRPIPPAPDAVEISAGRGTATVRWQIPEAGATSIDHYRLHLDQVGGFGPRGGDLDPEPGLRPGDWQTTEVTNVENGAPYEASVASVNDSGVSTAARAARVVTPRDRPGTPSIDAVPGSGHLGVVWWPAGSNDDGGSPVLSYTIRLEDQKGSGAAVPGPITVPAGDGGHDITGLTDGATYRVLVSATNQQGTGPERALENQTPIADGDAAWPDASMPPTVHTAPQPEDLGPLPPTAPTALEVVGGSTMLAVGWQPPVDDADSPVTSYVVRALPSGPTVTVPAGASPSAVLRGLRNGVAYRVEVRAVNAGGAGSPATSASVVPAGSPAPPRAPVLSVGPRGSRWLKLSWTSGNANGAVIVQHQTSCTSAGSRLVAGATRSVTYSRQHPKAVVSCVVRARNAVGWSAWSTRSPRVTVR